MSQPDKSSGYGLAPVAAARSATAPVLAYLPPRPRSFHPKIALIGCGGISEYHLRAYQAMHLDIVMLCDRDRARAEKRRAEFYPAAVVSADYRDALRRDDVAVVDVATHPSERTEIIEAALHAGKHVLSQKPFVLDLAVGERLANLAAEKKLKLAVNQNGRWAPHKCGTRRKDGKIHRSWSRLAGRVGGWAAGCCSAGQQNDRGGGHAQGAAPSSLLIIEFNYHQRGNIRQN